MPRAAGMENQAMKAKTVVAQETSKPLQATNATTTIARTISTKPPINMGSRELSVAPSPRLTTICLRSSVGWGMAVPTWLHAETLGDCA